MLTQAPLSGTEHSTAVPPSALQQCLEIRPCCRLGSEHERRNFYSNIRSTSQCEVQQQYSRTRYLSCSFDCAIPCECTYCSTRVQVRYVIFVTAATATEKEGEKEGDTVHAVRPCARPTSSSEQQHAALDIPGISKYYIPRAAQSPPCSLTATHEKNENGSALIACCCW